MPKKRKQPKPQNFSYKSANLWVFGKALLGLSEANPPKMNEVLLRLQTYAPAIYVEAANAAALATGNEKDAFRRVLITELYERFRGLAIEARPSLALPRKERSDNAPPVRVISAAEYEAERAPRLTTDPNTDAFLASYEWRRIRMQVFARDGRTCACCGADRSDGVKMHIDHIKPRRFFPELALDLDNLQVLCEVCNHGKGNWDQTDWRTPSEPPVYDPRDDFKNHLRLVK